MTSFRAEMEEKLKSPPLKAIINIICEEIISDKTKTAEIIDIALSDIPKSNYHACWVLNNLVKMKNNSIHENIDCFIVKLPQTNNDSQLAGILTVLYYSVYDMNKLAGNISFLENLLFTQKKQMFIVCNAMKLLFKTATKLPQFRDEIMEVFKLAYDIFENKYLKKKAVEYLSLLHKKSKS